LFRSISSGSKGGALYCSNSDTCFLIESTSFFSCKTNGNYCGGAIYLKLSSGQSVLYKVCGYACYTGATTGGIEYQFAGIYVNGSLSSKNYLNYSSIVCCVPLSGGAEKTIYLHYGKICCSSVNSSLNKCNRYSVFYCYTLPEPYFVTCSLAYSSFVDNAALYSYNCIWLDGYKNKFEIESCNILRNTQSYDYITYGTIYAYGRMTIKNSCILENAARYNFYQPIEFAITLSNCTVDQATSNKNLNIRNIVTKSFILALNHMSTQNCHSEYDSVGDLTPCTPEETPTPAPTPEETPEETPASTPEETPTPAPTPEETPASTPEETPEETPASTPEETHAPTPEETHAPTLEETHAPTLEETPTPTLVLDDDANAESDSLSGGAIAVIAITCIVVVVAISGIVIFIVFRKRSINADDSDSLQVAFI
jgi:hypothetical protein